MLQSEWLELEPTKELIKVLNEKIEEMKESWSDGVYTTETVDGTAQANAKAIGVIQGYQNVIEAMKGVQE
jgi:hypothetical protein